ncbi:hypothetical protein D9M69_392540 [compost metagenome]
MPNHVSDSKPGSPDSLAVGISGASGERFALVTASALSLPSFTCGSPETMLSNSTCTLPEIRSGTASAVPRYGMCVMNTLACALKASAVRCTTVPLPLEA